MSMPRSVFPVVAAGALFLQGTQAAAQPFGLEERVPNNALRIEVGDNPPLDGIGDVMESDETNNRAVTDESLTLAGGYVDLIGSIGKTKVPAALVIGDDATTTVPVMTSASLTASSMTVSSAVPRAVMSAASRVSSGRLPEVSMLPSKLSAPLL